MSSSVNSLPVKNDNLIVGTVSFDSQAQALLVPTYIPYLFSKSLINFKLQ